MGGEGGAEGDVVVSVVVLLLLLLLLLIALCSDTAPFSAAMASNTSTSCPSSP